MNPHEATTDKIRHLNNNKRQRSCLKLNGHTFQVFIKQFQRSVCINMTLTPPHVDYVDHIFKSLQVNPELNII